MKNKELIKVLKRFPPNATLKNVSVKDNGATMDILYVDDTDGMEFSISIRIADPVVETVDGK